MANNNTIQQIPLVGTLNMNTLKTEVKQFEGYNEKNSTVFGGELAPFYTRDTEYTGGDNTKYIYNSRGETFRLIQDGYNVKLQKVVGNTFVDIAQKSLYLSGKYEWAPDDCLLACEYNGFQCCFTNEIENGVTKGIMYYRSDSTSSFTKVYITYTQSGTTKYINLGSVEAKVFNGQLHFALAEAYTVNQSSTTNAYLVAIRCLITDNVPTFNLVTVNQSSYSGGGSPSVLTTMGYDSNNNIIYYYIVKYPDTDALRTLQWAGVKYNFTTNTTNVLGNGDVFQIEDNSLGADKLGYSVRLVTSRSAQTTYTDGSIPIGMDWARSAHVIGQHAVRSMYRLGPDDSN